MAQSKSSPSNAKADWSMPWGQLLLDHIEIPATSSGDPKPKF
jgi:hypothetical protein